MPPTSDDTTFVPVDAETIAELYAMYGLMPMSGGDGTDENPDDGESDDDGENDTDLPADLGDKGKEALKKTRREKADAIKRAKAAEAELETLRKAKEEADAAKAKADEEEAVKRGEFEQLATKRAEELTTVTGERDGLKSRLDKAMTLLASTVDAEWNDAPESVRKLYRGAADDPLDKKQFLTDHAELIAELKGRQDATTEKFRQASRTRTPNPDTSGKPVADDEARKAQARAVSRF